MVLPLLRVIPPMAALSLEMPYMRCFTCSPCFLLSLSCVLAFHFAPVTAVCPSVYAHAVVLPTITRPNGLPFVAVSTLALVASECSAMQCGSNNTALHVWFLSPISHNFWDCPRVYKRCLCLLGARLLKQRH